MLRVTTIYASHAGASADYYAKYLTQAPGEVPGVWTGKQADAFGLAGEVPCPAEAVPSVIVTSLAWGSLRALRACAYWASLGFASLRALRACYARAGSAAAGRRGARSASWTTSSRQMSSRE